jgi:hypothetical protein
LGFQNYPRGIAGQNFCSFETSSLNLWVEKSHREQEEASTIL